MSMHDERAMHLQDAIDTIAASPNFKLLSRLHSIAQIPLSEPSGNVMSAILVDTEATGLDPKTAKIIELALTRIEFDETGAITKIGEPQSWREDPGQPLDPLITQITGLTDADLAGQRLDEDAIVAAFLSTDVAIAHNASFDARLIEARLQALRGRPWICSCTDIAWRDYGYEGRALSHLLMQAGWFYDGHRAVIDVIALAALLSQPGRADTILKDLVEAARKPDYKIIAAGSPFETKDLLKARGYSWDADRKSWWRKCPGTDKDAELRWLAEAIYRGTSRAIVDELTWTTRHR